MAKRSASSIRWSNDCVRFCPDRIKLLDKSFPNSYQYPRMSSPNLDVRDVARLARIELTDEEATTFQSQLGRVLEYVEQLKTLDVSGVEPTAHANPVFNVLREDVAHPGLTREAALSNAPHSANNLVVVTKVIE
jgi:aspartyl-tRNA(Asn)/glutamyl-tRNA(Gln) amidotransferase subunit C